MNIYTNDANSILFKDLIYNDFYDESDIIESNKCSKDNVFVYVVGMDIDYDLLLRKLPKNVFPAYDGLSLSLKK